MKVDARTKKIETQELLMLRVRPFHDHVIIGYIIGELAGLCLCIIRHVGYAQYIDLYPFFQNRPVSLCE
jgi:hypothetical protein